MNWFVIITTIVVTSDIPGRNIGDTISKIHAMTDNLEKCETFGQEHTAYLEQTWENKVVSIYNCENLPSEIGVVRNLDLNQ